jgi:hypothetical protein
MTLDNMRANGVHSLGVWCLVVKFKRLSPFESAGSADISLQTA